MQGGVVVYTGMNDAGDFYVGNRRLSSATGQEETIGIPIPRKVGDDGGDDRLSVIFDDVTVKDFLKVEGGSGNSETSEFNGPVVFNNKVNFNSDLGNDFNFITLKEQILTQLEENILLELPLLQQMQITVLVM